MRVLEPNEMYYDPVTLFLMEIGPDEDGDMALELKVSPDLLIFVYQAIQDAVEESEDDLTEKEVKAVTQDAIVTFAYDRGRVV